MVSSTLATRLLTVFTTNTCWFDVSKIVALLLKLFLFGLFGDLYDLVRDKLGSSIVEDLHATLQTQIFTQLIFYNWEKEAMSNLTDARKRESKIPIENM